MTVDKIVAGGTDGRHLLSELSLKEYGQRQEYDPSQTILLKIRGQSLLHISVQKLSSAVFIDRLLRVPDNERAVMFLTLAYRFVPQT
jgi:hypothetical protein